VIWAEHRISRVLLLQVICGEVELVEIILPLSLALLPGVIAVIIVIEHRILSGIHARLRIVSVLAKGSGIYDWGAKSGVREHF